MGEWCEHDVSWNHAMPPIKRRAVDMSSKGKGEIVKVSSKPERRKSYSNQSSKTNRLPGQKGLPSKTKTVVDYSYGGYDVTYEV